MTVRTLLAQSKRDVITSTPSTSIDSAMDLLINNNIGCLPILDGDDKLIGIVSDKDIFKKIHETKGDYHKLSVSEVMSTDLVIGIPEDDLSYIAGVMDKNWIRHVPIVEGDRVIGLVSLRDINKTAKKAADIENRYLNLYMESLHRRDKSGDL